MKTLLALLLLIGTTVHTHAAEQPPCDQPVRFSAGWFADPEVDNGQSLADLQKLGARAGQAATGVQLGHVVVETRLATAPQPGCRGIVVRLDYIKPVLRVAREFAPGSCAHARVMNHELTHVRIHRDIAREFRELRYPWRSGTRSGNPAAILAYARQELDRLMQAQVRFDSPEEYARNHSACGGEIGRLVRPAGTAAPAAKKSG